MTNIVTISMSQKHIDKLDRQRQLQNRTRSGYLQYLIEQDVKHNHLLEVLPE